MEFQDNATVKLENETQLENLPYKEHLFDPTFKILANENFDSKLEEMTCLDTEVEILHAKIKHEITDIKLEEQELIIKREEDEEIE